MPHRLDHFQSCFCFSNKVGIAARFRSTGRENMHLDGQTLHAPFACRLVRKLTSSLDVVRGFHTSLSPRVCVAKLHKSILSQNVHSFHKSLSPHVCLSKPEKSVLSLTLRGLHTDDSSQSHHDSDAPLTLQSEEDVVRLAEEVMREASRLDVMVRSVPASQVEQLVVDLHQCGWQAPEIVSLLAPNPSYIHHHRNLLPIVHLLLTHGLGLQQVASILQRFPPIVQVRPSQVSRVVEALRECGFWEKSIAKVLTQNPAILLVAGATTLSQRVGALRQLFTAADVITLAMVSPEVLTDEWEEVQARFDYVFHEMNVTQKQMVYAALFSHSLAHVRNRHTFLVRAGLFDLSKRREGEKSPNARLDQIIDTSDEAFAHKFGGFGVEEYRTFCLLHEKERAELADSDSDNDDAYLGK